MQWLFVSLVLAGLVLMVGWARRQSRSRGEPPCGWPIRHHGDEASALRRERRGAGETDSDCADGDGGGGGD